MTPPERPWIPDLDALPWRVYLIDPQGVRHLGFNDEEGRFYRLWPDREPTPLHTGEAIALRPSDIDQIVKLCFLWLRTHPGHPRRDALVDEVAAGAKAIVLHFAELAAEAGHPVRREPPRASVTVANPLRGFPGLRDAQS
ncbi:hypothetical protein ACWEJ6_50870 [Nonomuraea sp. NPDC004702]